MEVILSFVVSVLTGFAILICLGQVLSLVFVGFARSYVKGILRYCPDEFFQGKAFSLLSLLYAHQLFPVRTPLWLVLFWLRDGCLDFKAEKGRSNPKLARFLCRAIAPVMTKLLQWWDAFFNGI